MGDDVAESVELPYCNTVKVHRLMCLELKKLIHKISHIYSDIEATRPGCTSGMHALCSFLVALDKAKLLIQHCSESSKLYLAITADRIQLRFERLRNTFELCLNQIQNIVPPLLAAKICEIIHDLRNAKFPLEPSEDEAGKVLLELLKRDNSASSSIDQLELEALQHAALRLNITSPLALLIEKRSIKKLCDKIGDTDTTKKKILEYLLYLLRKYGEPMCKTKNKSPLAMHEELNHESIETQLKVRREWDENPVDESGILEPPEEYICPFSLRLMYDPVVIASGKTFERVWIERWFNNGHNTCPETHMRLETISLTPNLAMKGLISKWCLKHGITILEPQLKPMPALLSSTKTASSSSVASFGSSMDDLCLHISNVSFHSSDTDRSLHPSKGKINDFLSHASPLKSENHYRYQASSTRNGIDLTSLSKLALRPWGSQCDVVKNVKEQLKDSDQPCQLAFSNSYVKPMIMFLKDAHNLCDAKALKDGAELLLAILSHSRDEMPPFHEDEIFTLTSFLDCDIMQKALEIIEVLSRRQHCMSNLVASGIIPSILKFLDIGTSESHEVAIKILCNLSSDDDIVYHIIYLDCIPKLVLCLQDPILSRYCIKIIKSLCTYEETRTAVAETNPCISSIAMLLETGTREEQEDLVEILLSLCHEYAKYCQLAHTESIIQCLVEIAVNGNSRGKETALELLNLLGHCKEDNSSVCSKISTDTSHDFSSHRKEKKLFSVASRFLRRKIARFFTCPS